MMLLYSSLQDFPSFMNIYFHMIVFPIFTVSDEKTP